MERTTNRRGRAGRPVVTRMKSSTRFALFFVDSCFVALACAILYFFRDTLTQWSGYTSVLGLLWRGVLLCFAIGSLCVIHFINYYYWIQVSVQGGMVKVRRYTLPWRTSFFVIANDFEGYYNVREVKNDGGRTTSTEAVWIVKKGKLMLRLHVDDFENTMSVVDAMGIECIGSLQIPNAEIVGYQTGSRLLPVE